VVTSNLQDLFTEDAVKTEGLISTFESGYKEAKSRLTSEEEQVALWRIVSLAFNSNLWMHSQALCQPE
jgi:hypothetical protein